MSNLPRLLLARVLAACGLMCLTGCAMTQKAETTAGPTVHDLAPAFITFWQTVASQSADEQVAAFKTGFAPQFPQFYEYTRKNWETAGKDPDNELKKQLLEFPSIKDEFKRKTTDMTENLQNTLQSFVQSFPDLNTHFDVYITHSLGSMDGGTRIIGDKRYFILGIDGMVKYHKGFTSEVPFFHHELFHIYHGQYLPEEQVIWVALWTEGLATYASEKLNPGASRKDLMLDMPEGMVNAVENTSAYHWNDLNAKLLSREDDDYAAYFLLSSQNKHIAIRAGYYLGYLLAKEIGKRHSISDMAKMDRTTILPLLRKHIKKLSGSTE